MQSTLRKCFTAIAVLTVTGLVTGAANAAECQLRNISYVGVLNSGLLVINAEMWNATTGTQLGGLYNSVYCQIGATMNGIAPSTCQAWHTIAMTAMLSNKRVWINANQCLTGNGVNLPGIANFGLNH